MLASNDFMLCSPVSEIVIHVGVTCLHVAGRSIAIVGSELSLRQGALTVCHTLNFHSMFRRTPYPPLELQNF